MIRRSATIIALIALASACSVGSRAPRTPGYLFQIEPIAREVNTAVADMRIALDQPLESDDLFVNAIVDVRLGTRLAVERDRLRRIEPPEEYAADHAAYVATIETLQDAAAELDGSLVAPPDRVRAALSGARLETAAATGFTSLAPQMCRFASFDLSLCAPVDFYTATEAAAHRALLSSAIIVHSYSAIPASSGPKDVAVIARAYANISSNALQRTAADLEVLDDPAGDLAALAANLRRMVTELGADNDDGLARTAVNSRLAWIRSSICDLAPRFPAPEPLPAEGGGTVEIDGFAKVWFVYGGRCEA